MEEMGHPHVKWQTPSRPTTPPAWGTIHEWLIGTPARGATLDGPESEWIVHTAGNDPGTSAMARIIGSGTFPRRGLAAGTNTEYPLMEYSERGFSLWGMSYSPETYRAGLKLAELLRDAREQAGLTQVQAAEVLGVSQNWISKSEIAERTMRFVEVEQMAIVYGKTIDFFLTQGGKSSAKSK